MTAAGDAMIEAAIRRAAADDAVNAEAMEGPVMIESVMATTGGYITTNDPQYPPNAMLRIDLRFPADLSRLDDLGVVRLVVQLLENLHTQQESGTPMLTKPAPQLFVP